MMTSMHLDPLSPFDGMVLKIGTIYNAEDSDGLPESMRCSSDTLEHFPSTQNSPAFACSSVRGMRREMEDEHISERPLVSRDGEHANLFGVFDGHGGQRCSKFLHAHLATAVRQRCLSFIHAFFCVALTFLVAIH